MIKKLLSLFLLITLSACTFIGCKQEEEQEEIIPPPTPITFTYNSSDVEISENAIADSYLGVDARGIKIKFLKENATFTIDNTFKLENGDNKLYSFVASPMLSSFNNKEADIGKITFKFTDIKTGRYLTIEHEGDGSYWREGNDEQVFECSRLGVAGNGQKIGGTKRESTSKLDLGTYHPLNSPFTGSKFSVIDVSYNVKKNMLYADPAGYYFPTIVRDFSYAYEADPVTWDGFNEDAELKLTITLNKLAHKSERQNTEASIVLVSVLDHEFYSEES